MSESFENVFEIDVAEMLELLQITIIRMILGQFLGCRIRDLWKFWMAFEIDPKLVRNLILILRPPTLKGTFYSEGGEMFVISTTI